MARIVTWICDKCGAKKSDIDNDFMSFWEGWATIHLVKDGKPIHADLCPKCANEINFD